MKKANNWLRLLRYIIVWFACTLITNIPLYIRYADSLKKGGFQTLANTDSLFLGLSQLAAIIATALTTYIVVIRIEKRSLSEIFLTLNTKALFKGVGMGTFLMLLLVFVIAISGSVRFSYQTISWNLIYYLFIFLAVSVVEEIVVRGYILKTIKGKIGDKGAIIISSLIFGSFHLFNDNISVIGIVNISLSGVLMGSLCLRDKSVSAPIGLHWAWNFIQGPIAGFSVSGLSVNSLFTATPISSSFYSGGDFGAEGSIWLIPITLIFAYFNWPRSKDQNKTLNEIG